MKDIAGCWLAPYPAYSPYCCRPGKALAATRHNTHNDQYSFLAQSSQSPLNGRFMFSIASMMSW